MQESWTIDLMWWITAVEMPAMASLFWMIWRNRRDFEDEQSQNREHFETGLTKARESLSAYKLEVAQNYASIAYMKDVERRLTGHLVRIENKLDVVPHHMGGKT